MSGSWSPGRTGSGLRSPGRTGSGLRSSVLVLVLVLVGPVSAVSEPGKWIRNIDSETLKKQNNTFFFTKTMFNGTFIHLKLLGENCNSSPPVQLNVSWYLRNSHCYDEVFSLDLDRAKSYFRSKEVKHGGGSGFYVFHQYPVITCTQHMSPNKFGLEQFEMKTRLTEEPKPQQITEKTLGGRKKRSDMEPLKPKAAAPAPAAAAVKTEDAPAATGKATIAPKEVNQVATHPHFDVVAESWEDGPYMFILNIREIKDKIRAPDPATPPTPWSLQLQISMKGPHDYISAAEWPMMVFYMVMCIVYVLLAVLWLLLSACYWRDLLRIQFWIGGVIFLGMLEKAVYYAEFQSIRYDGLSGVLVPLDVLSRLEIKTA